MKLPRWNGDRKGSQTGDKQPRQRGHALRTRAFRAGGYSAAAALIGICAGIYRITPLLPICPTC